MQKNVGNCLVAQSGGPTAVINSSLYGVLTAAMECKTIDKIYGGLHGIEGIINGKIINILDFPSKILKQIKYSPAAALGSCRYRLKDFKEGKDDYIRIFEAFEKYNIRYFFYIGGNDSMDTADKINKYADEIGYDVKVIGIPKTIDNDLMFTDHCPGYGSAAKYIATTTLEIALDTEVYPKNTINVLEVMGRNAGWLTASAALVREKIPWLKHLIYIPEIVFDENKFLEDVENAYKRNGNIFIAVSEGIVDKNGEYVSKRNNMYTEDAFGHAHLGGVGDYIEKIIKENIYKRVKMVRLGTTQRCAMHFASKTDFEEAEVLGERAVEFAIRGISGKMVSIVRKSNYPYVYDIDIVDLNKVCNKEKKIPLSMINEEGNNVTKEFIEYARPLIYGEIDLPFIDGLPHYTNLKYSV
jgi:6-phosphofructokinase 1